MPKDWLRFGVKHCWHKKFCVAKRRVTVITPNSFGSKPTQILWLPSQPISKPCTTRRSVETINSIAQRSVHAMSQWKFTKPMGKSFTNGNT